MGDTKTLSAKPLRTHHIAKAIGVHVNTVRKYEESGFLAPVPRAANGYREYTVLHLEQARLAHLALHYPYVGDRTQLFALAQSAASGDLNMAMELAYRYLALVRVERTYAESAVEFLERWAAGYAVDVSGKTMHISDAATHLDVSVDMLRNWERNGLIRVPRDPTTGYRRYGSAEFGRLRVIRMLVQNGFSLMAVLKMLHQFDSGRRDNLRAALDLPPEDSINPHITIVADRWLATLLELEGRAQDVIAQVGRLMEMQRQT
jgi:DNA-binding transcriptional MerR regulator